MCDCLRLNCNSVTIVSSLVHGNIPSGVSRLLLLWAVLGDATARWLDNYSIITKHVYKHCFCVTRVISLMFLQTIFTTKTSVYCLRWQMINWLFYCRHINYHDPLIVWCTVVIINVTFSPTLFCFLLVWTVSVSRVNMVMTFIQSCCHINNLYNLVVTVSKISPKWKANRHEIPVSDEALEP